VQVSNRILGLAAQLLLSLGLGFIVLGLYLLWQTQIFDSNAVRVTGTVVSYREVSDGDQQRFRPRVRFTAPNGDITTFDGQMSTTTKRFAVGAPVPVVYSNAEPMKARIDSFTDNWLAICIAGIVGFVAAVAGFLIKRSVRREAAKA
jgi:Protein of unknown function (DUF3592)